ncbi:MAG: DUF2975 domain-containing protein [Oscillospiraceae bacterium]|nr:DUF2975 domain-containing protein [Oscillospiraceae bacterium]
MEQILSKNETITKIRKGSMIIAVLCLIAAAFNLFVVGTEVYYLLTDAHTTQSGYWARIMIGYGINCVILLSAASVFFRISKNGRPFTRGNIMIVRGIGVLFIVNAVLPMLINAAIDGNPNMLFSLLDPTGVVEGILFLFVAQILHYGSLLQQESDETL